MKMKREHYNILRDCMIASRRQPAVVELDVYGGLSNLGFVWNWLYMTPIEGKKAEAWMVENLYPYLEDSHIQTAILRILRSS